MGGGAANDLRRRRLLLGGAALLASACDRQDRDGDAGRRVVSLSPNTTEAVYALGAEAQLVGRSEQCDHPAAARSLRSVGSFAQPNLEAILALRPTLVVGARGPAGPVLEEHLQAHGIATFFPPMASLADVQAMLRGLGDRLGTRTAAETRASEMTGAIEALAAWAKPRCCVRVVMVFDTGPIIVAGPGGFLGELLTLAGGTNVIEAGGAYPTIGLERLLTLDPSVVVDATRVDAVAGSSTLPALPGWGELRAVKEGRVRTLTTSAALRPGPRIAAGLADVVRALHGEVPP